MKLYDLKDPVNLDYARSRLNGTIVRTDDRAVRVETISGRGKVVCTVLRTDEMIEVKWNNLDITPVPLGYVNSGGSAFYLTRIPMRRDWKQGLRGNNMGTSNGRLLERLSDRVLAKTIENTYPSFKEVFETMVKEGGAILSRAFSRNFSITNRLEIEYKGRFSIGKIDEANSTYELYPKFDWAREALEEEFVV